MPSLAKTAIAAALTWSGTNAWLGRRPSGTPLVLGYHRVVENIAAIGGQTLPGMAITQQTLRAHLEWVARRYCIVSLDELCVLLEQRVPCGHLAAVTFDDGYRDVHDHALPILRKMGLPAAVFVVSSLIGTRNSLVHDELYQFVSEVSSAKRVMPLLLANALNGCDADRGEGTNAVMQTVRALLAKPPAELRNILQELRAQGPWVPPPRELATVDWAALVAMQRAGMIIGSHTHTHALLVGEDDGTVLEELRRSRSELEAGLGTPVHHFAYPDGRFSPRIVRAVATAGYRFAYTICDHSDSDNRLLTIPRVMLWESSCTDAFGHFSESLMCCHADSVLPFPSRCRDDHGIEPRWYA